MAATGASIAYRDVMEALGFYRDGRPTENVYSSQDLSRDSALFDRRVKYRAVLDPQRLGATDIFELSGAPCIYFKDVGRTPSGDEVDAWHRVAWNHGLAPMLWVVSPTHVHIYDCYSERPGPTAPRGKPDWQLFFYTLADGLKQLQDQVARRQVESPRFWVDGIGSRIDRGNRVDSSLLQDLGDTAEVLQNRGLDLREAHELLLRAVFVSYIESRGILRASKLRDLFGVAGFVEALGDAATTAKVFSWMARTFNGDLFPQGGRRHKLPKGRFPYSQEQLDIVRMLLEGGNPKTGQKFLWRYQFDVIPVELISSIYEKFTHAADSEEARKQSTHYTPMSVVDLTLSQVFDDELFSAELPRDARVVDLACGSGVFLVESLRRLVALRLARGEDLSRSLVRDVLHNQIYGVDISPEAVHIAALSLYLAALELESSPRLDRTVKFKPLIWDGKSRRTKRNLIVADAFDVDSFQHASGTSAVGRFQIIVGNPPWKRPEGRKAPSYVDYCRSHDPPLPLGKGNPPDQAFLWLALQLAAPHARIGLVVHGQWFFSHEPDARKTKAGLMTHLAPRMLFNLSELRQEKLFPTSMQPAMVFVAENRRPEPGDHCLFAAPERRRSFKKDGLLEIGPELIKRLPLRRVAEDEVFLKVATWGSARDMALIDRLRADERFRSLGKLVQEWGWPSWGRGVDKDPILPVPENLPRKFLDSGNLPPIWVDVANLPTRDPSMRISRGHSRPEIYHAPLVIVTRGIRKGQVYGALAREDVLYTKQYIGLPASRSPAWRYHYLNGIFNSRMASYLLFLTSGTWAVERTTLEKTDWENLLVPDPAKLAPSSKEAFCTLVEKLCSTKWSPHDLAKVRRQLDPAVFGLYGLSDSERVLVEDGVDLTTDRYCNLKSKAFRPPDPGQLQAYAEHFIGVVADFLHTSADRTATATIPIVDGAPLQAVHFRVGGGRSGASAVTIESQPELRGVLDEIAKVLPAQLTPTLYSRRHVRVYGQGELFIIKPRELRFWSRSAGLNDADAVLAEHVRIAD